MELQLYHVTCEICGEPSQLVYNMATDKFMAMCKHCHALNDLDKIIFKIDPSKVS